MTLTLCIRTDEPCYAILSESYDDGWHIHEENSTEPLITQEYNSLIMIRIPDAGTYNLDLRFTSYDESMNRIMLFSSGAFCLIALSYVLQRTWKLAMSTISHTIRKPFRLRRTRRKEPDDKEAQSRVR